MATATVVPLIKRKSVPDEGPFITTMVICPTCAQVVLPVLTRMNSGQISDISFYHVNEEYGCAWKNIDPKRRSPGETVGLRENVRTGNDKAGQPIFVNERELAKGRSFDLDGLKPQDLLPPYVHDAPPVPYEAVQFADAVQKAADIQSGATAVVSSAVKPKFQMPKKGSGKKHEPEPKESKQTPADESNSGTEPETDDAA